MPICEQVYIHRFTTSQLRDKITSLQHLFKPIITRNSSYCCSTS